MNDKEKQKEVRPKTAISESHGLSKKEKEK
jgi:hypothetical protein